MAELILAILLAFFVHEGGHWMAARLFSGSGSSFASRGDDSTCLVSSVCGPCPTCQKASRESLPCGRVLVTEFLVAGALLASFPHGFGRWVAGVALAHLVSYRFYAGESESDFKWL